MKLFALVGAICALSQTALAQTGECKLIADATARLACYDKASPPVAIAKPAAPKTPAAAGKPAPSKTTLEQQGQVGDMLAAENARLDAKINNICRGC